MRLRVNLGRATLVGEAIGGSVVATIVGHGLRSDLGAALAPEDRARVDSLLSGSASVVLTPAACAALCSAFESLATIAQEQTLAADLASVAEQLPAHLAAQLQGGR